jgi:hypothetical protein
VAKSAVAQLEAQKAAKSAKSRELLASKKTNNDGLFCIVLPLFCAISCLLEASFWAVGRDDFCAPIGGESFPSRVELVKEAFTEDKYLNDKGLGLCI